MHVVTVAEMREAEQAAFAAGMSEAELQTRAGAAVAACAQRLAPAGNVVVLAGVGNNGRDAWVAACDLARAGRAVRLYLAPRHMVTDDELASFLAAGGALALHTGEESVTALWGWLGDASLAVDGLLGIGVRGAPRPPIADIATVVNSVHGQRAGGLRVLAIDVPSGVDADSGAAEGECVQADATVVLGALKEGLLRFPGAGLAGVLYAGDIGLPPQSLAAQPVATLERATVRAEVPPRVPWGHKGTFGRVVVAAGSPDYYGAAYLAGAAAARSGCGLLAFAAAPALQGVLAGLLPEATYVVLPAGAPESGAAEAAERVSAGLGDAGVLLVGPGLGRSDGAIEFVARLLGARAAQAESSPAVVDADALYVLATVPELWRHLAPGAVLTPHHGEMARLTGHRVDAILADPWGVAVEAASRWNQVVVLKGPFTVVAAPQGRAWVLPHSNPALGTGGTGDVLAGTIAGLLAQGLEAAAAARVGVYVHAAAAHAVLARSGADLLLASDLLGELPRQLAALRAERGERHAAWWVPWADRL